jgi:hypothetical protein
MSAIPPQRRNGPPRRDPRRSQIIWDGSASWLVFVIVLPFLGVLVYLIARGGKMASHDAAQAKAQDEAFRAYVREAAPANSNGTAGELTKLADLRDHGVISEADFQRGKEKILSRPAA